MKTSHGAGERPGPREAAELAQTSERTAELGAGWPLQPGQRVSGRGQPGENSTRVSPGGREASPSHPRVVPNIKCLVPPAMETASWRAAKTDTRERGHACEGHGRVSRSSPGWPGRARDPDHVVLSRKRVGRRQAGGAGPPPHFIPAPHDTPEALETSPVREVTLPHPLRFSFGGLQIKLARERLRRENADFYSCAHMPGTSQKNVTQRRN